jgi:hypothetical protein
VLGLGLLYTFCPDISQMFGMSEMSGMSGSSRYVQNVRFVPVWDTLSRFALFIPVCPNCPVHAGMSRFVPIRTICPVWDTLSDL